MNQFSRQRQTARQRAIPSDVKAPAYAYLNRVGEPIRERFVPWARTREGTASLVVSFALFAFLILAAFPVLFALFTALGVGTGAIAVAARSWNARTAPQAPSYSHCAGSASGAIELRRDENAGFWSDRRGFLWESRIWFAGTGCPPHRVQPMGYADLYARHGRGERPVLVTRSSDRQWWWFGSRFYWDTGALNSEQVEALLFMSDRSEHRN